MELEKKKNSREKNAEKTSARKGEIVSKTLKSGNRLEKNFLLASGEERSKRKERLGARGERK